MQQWIEINQAGIHWRLTPECQSELFDENGLRLPQWLKEDRAKIVKQGPHRTVYRLSLPNLKGYLKHNHASGKRAKVRQWVKSSKAKLEYQRLCEVAQRQVATLTPLAYGESEKDSFLLTKELSAEPLSEFLERVLPTLSLEQRIVHRHHVAKSLGQFLAKMHDAGIVHRDLHPGNLLMDRESHQLTLIDLDQVQLSDNLSWKARLGNLVILNRWFSLRSSRTDRLRCWKSYAQTCGLSSYETRQLAFEVEEQTTQSNLAFWAGLDSRCLKNNRRFYKVHHKDIVGHAVTDLNNAVLEELLSDPDAPFAQPNARILKDSRTSTVVEMDIPLHGSTQRVIYKRFNIKKWSSALASLCRPTPALRSWINGHGLRQRWLPTPRPLLVLHRKRHGLLHEGYLMTAKITPSMELQDFVQRLQSFSIKEQRRILRYTIQQLGISIRTMHQREVSQRDLKACNLLVIPDALIQGAIGEKQKTIQVTDAASPIDYWPLTNASIWLIDLVGVHCALKVTKERKIQNLIRLHASFHDSGFLTRTEKLRFLRSYLQWGLRGRESWKAIWRAIEKGTREKVAKNARSGRVLA